MIKKAGHLERPIQDNRRHLTQQKVLILRCDIYFNSVDE